MKNKITFLSFLFLLLSSILHAQYLAPIPKERPLDYEYLSAPDSTGKRTLLKSPSVISKDLLTSQQILPYPIIFIHGLNSNAATWNATTDNLDASYGFTYGGRFDFCLNFDGDYTIANKNFYPTTDADLALYTDPSNPTQIGVGDYYFLNFAVGLDGSVFPSTSNSYYVTSEQSAIAKQGLALKWAISYVLQKTGRDKVILMGHSMGGLCAREYLQNSNNWQPDGQHHVAKLVTTGTPHGGSNSTAFGLPIGGLDEQSEAVRDLRRTYFYSGDYGVFLYGGLELQNNSTHMDDNLNLSGIDFYNVDVNCNGITGENITGLNYKNISSNLDYACIIGECSGCADPNQGDGVVNDVCANLTNYYSGLNVNLFYYYASASIQIHTDLPSQDYQNMQGLDEPNEYNIAYGINFNTTYKGFTTIQPVGGYTNDYDDFKFSVSVETNVSVSISNISLSDLMVHIVDLNGNTVGSTVHSYGSSSINFTQIVSAGNYYFEIYGVPTSTSYFYPYTFTLTKAPVANFTSNSNGGCQGVSINFSDQSTEYPSSWSWTFNGGTPYSSNLSNPTVVYNSAGTYPVTLTVSNQNGSNTKVISSYITINPIPPKPVITQSGNQLISDALNGNQWYENWTNLISGATNQSFWPSHDGYYSVRVTLNGCTSDWSNEIHTTVLTAPSISLSANPSTVCAGTSVQLNTSASGGDGSYSYTWSSWPTGFWSDISNPTVTPTENTYYNVTVTSGGLNSNANTQVIVNHIPLTPTIYQNGNQLVSDASSGNQWYENWSPISGEINPTFTPSHEGWYLVMVTNNGCTSAPSNEMHILSVEEITVNSNFLVYPNPVTQKLYIETLKSNFKLKFEIFNSIGQLVFSSIIDKKAIVDISHFANGFYDLNIYEGQNIYTKRLIKE